jgi:hypothetical protein
MRRYYHTKLDTRIRIPRIAAPNFDLRTLLDAHVVIGSRLRFIEGMCDRASGRAALVGGAVR